MGNLSSCLRKIGLSEHERAILRGAAEENAKEGDESYVAAVRAVSDYLQSLERERNSIAKQVEDKGGKVAEAPFKVAELSGLMAAIGKKDDYLPEGWTQGESTSGTDSFSYRPNGTSGHWAVVSQLIGNSYKVNTYNGSELVSSDEYAGTRSTVLGNTRKTIDERTAQPAHIENGKVENATASVIAASINKSAKNTKFDHAEALKWMVTEVKAAIKDAPTAEDQGIWDRVNKKIKLDGVMDVAERIGFKVFDVPGDGKFKILNVKEKLEDFLKKVESNPGFKKPKAIAKPQLVPDWQKTSSAASEGEVRNMLEDGDYTAAYEFSKQIGKPLVFGFSAKEKPIPYTDVREFEVEGYDDFNFVTGRSFSKDKDGNVAGRWHVIELSTGLSMGNASTKKAVEAQVRGALTDKNLTPEKLAKTISEANAKGDGKTQDALAAEWMAWAEEQESGAVEDQKKAVEAKKPEIQRDDEARDKEYRKGWHSVSVGAGGQIHYKRQFEFEGKPVEAVMWETAGRYDDGYVMFDGKKVFSERDTNGNVQEKIDRFLESRYLSQNHDVGAGAYGATQEGESTASTTTTKQVKDENGNTATEVTLPSGKIVQIQKLNSSESMGLPGWHSPDGYLADTKEQAVKELERKDAAVDAKKEEKSEPNPLDYTPKQYHDAVLQYMADKNDVSLSEVRENYDTEAGRNENNLKWINAVRAAARDGKELSRQTLDKLHELNDRAVSELMHDYPEANIPSGYQTPSGRQIEKQNADDRKADRQEAKRSADAGEELTYNKRNRRKGGLSWDDISDKNATLQAKEVVKAKVYPKPDYEALVAGGMKPMLAHLVKQAYDGISSKPKLGRGEVLGEATYKAYIEGVNRVMGEVLRWVNDPKAIASWAQRNARMLGSSFSVSDTFSNKDTMYDFVYPNGWKAAGREVYYLGGNKFLGSLQPGYDEINRANKDIKMGWPTSVESWKKQGYKIVEATNIIAESQGRVPSGKEPFVYTYMTSKQADGKTATIETMNVRGTSDIDAENVQKAIGDRVAELNGKFVLQDKVGRIVGLFDSQEDAEEGARNATKREKGDGEIKEIGRHVTEVQRIGSDRRMEGQDVSAADLVETFGFRGVNFGNSMSGDSKSLTKERQMHLNHIYDAFMDLAELMNVPPKALSLNGMLGIAVGAQGSGKALAHFVPGVNEINITRRAGAGALAHEFGHALDHYFGTLAGFGTRTEPYLTANVDAKKETVQVDGKWVTRDVEIQGVRPEVVAQFKSIVEAMTKRKETQEEYEERLKSGIEQSKEKLAQWVNYFKKEAAKTSPDRAAEIEAIGKRLADMDTGDGVVAIGKGVEVSPTVIEIKEAYEKAVGSAPKNDYLVNTQYYVDRIKLLDGMLKAGVANEPAVVDTTYNRSSKAADGKKKPYWSTKLEMFARAFDAYVVDSLEAKEAKNQYLAGIEAVAPSGSERETINRAFDFLFAELKTKETDKGIALYSSHGQFTSNGNPVTFYDYYQQQASAFNRLPEQDRAAASNSTDVRGDDELAGVRRRAGSTLADGVAKDFSDRSAAKLTGRVVQSPEDLAVAAQIYRNPRLETARYFFVSNGVIIGQTAVSSRKPGVTRALIGSSLFEQARHVDDIANQAKSLGADSIWILHNHPDGKPIPSDSDIGATNSMAGAFEARGLAVPYHVIINNKSYGVITVGATNLKADVVVYDFGSEAQYDIDTPRISHPLLGQNIFSPADLALNAKKAQVSSGQVVVIGISGGSGIRTISEVSPEQLRGERGAATLRRIAKQTGSDRLFAYGVAQQDISSVQQAIKLGLLVDAIVLDDNVEYSVLGMSYGLRKYEGYSLGSKDIGHKVETSVSSGESSGQYSKSAKRTNNSPEVIRKSLVDRFGERGIRALEKMGMLKVIRLEDAPSGVLEEAIEQNASAIYTKDGVAYLFSDRMTAEEAPAKLLHEIGEHHGLERILGSDGWGRLQRRVATMAKVRGSVAYAAWNGVKANYREFGGMTDEQLATNERFTHEVLAAIGENQTGLKTSLFRELLAMVKEWLASKGFFTESINEGDIVNLVSGSLKKVMKQAEAGMVAPSTMADIANKYFTDLVSALSADNLVFEDCR